MLGFGIIFPFVHGFITDYILMYGCIFLPQLPQTRFSWHLWHSWHFFPTCIRLFYPPKKNTAADWPLWSFWMAGAEGLVCPLAVPEIACALERRAISTAAPSPPRCIRHRRRFSGDARHARASGKVFYRKKRKKHPKALFPFWQGQKDLNPRHAVLETAALPTELYPYIFGGPSGTRTPSRPVMSRLL